MHTLSILKNITLFIFLTVLTQIGGIVYIVNVFFYKYYSDISSKLKKIIFRLLGFMILYFSVSFMIVPPLAKSLGRVPLPMFSQKNIKPLNILTCLLNRHYVNPGLKKNLLNVAEQTDLKYPGTVINYLDANFPFFDNFPLVPHLSHNDGKKLDISFAYMNSKTLKSTNDCPSFFGYGICEEPMEHEENIPDYCAQKGNWQYSFIKKITPQNNKKNYLFDSEKTKFIITTFSKQQQISKIFIEPHLKNA